MKKELETLGIVMLGLYCIGMCGVFGVAQVGDMNTIFVDSCGNGNGSFGIVAMTALWLEPGVNETEVFVGTDVVGVSVWEDQKRRCWLEEKELDIFVDTKSKEDFEICGCFLLSNGGTINITLCSVNVTEVRENAERGNE